MIVYIIISFILFLIAIALGISSLQKTFSNSFVKKEGKERVSSILTKKLPSNCRLIKSPIIIGESLLGYETDFILICPKGILVIYVIDFEGTLYGNRESSKWVFKKWFLKHTARNYLQDKSLHLKTLKKVLDINDDAIRHLIVMSGDGRFVEEFSAGSIEITTEKELMNYILQFRMRDGTYFDVQKLYEKIRWAVKR